MKTSALLFTCALALPAAGAAESPPAKASVVVRPEKIDARLLDERELFRRSIDAGTTRAKSLDEVAKPTPTPERVPEDFALREWANKPLVFAVGEAKVDEKGKRVTIRTKDGEEVAFRLPPEWQKPEAARELAKEWAAPNTPLAKAVAIYAENGGEKLLLKVSQNATYEIPSPGPTPVPIVVPPGPQPTPPGTAPGAGQPVKSRPNPK